MDFKKLFENMLPVIVALILYDLVIKGLISKVSDTYDDTLDHFDA